ncbi:MAG TPA: hypothetical protein VKT18_00565, partial [Acidimicrobiales bacterium]|nr:hypothetical protein [Acidimicrobiales bacterium]
MHTRSLGLALGALAIAAAPVALAAPAGAAGHAPKLSVRVAVHPRVLLADGKDTARVLVFLRHGGRADAKATVTLATADTPSGGGSCGTLAATSGTTRRDGVFSTTYTASSAVGFCTITATSGTAAGSVTLDQRDPTLAAAGTQYRVRGTASPTRIAPNGTSTSTITFTVTNGTTPVAGDAIWVSAFSLGHGTCGTVALASPTTGSNGQVTATYTSSTTRG